jgi:hypothetical protein
MKVVIRKASSDDWYTIKNFETFQSVVDYMNKKNHPLILRDNFFYGMPLDTIMYAWNDVDMTEEKAREMQSIKYELEIYDDYIE